MPVIETILKQRFPDLEKEKLISLSNVWNDVLHRIINRMYEISQPEMVNLHINLKEDMALELVKLQLHIGEKIVDEHLKGKNPKEILPEKEQKICFGEKGLEKIENTAKILSEHIWLRLYKERWEPKTKAALKKENNPKKKTIVVHQKEDNHFIPKSFIKRYWSSNGKVVRCTIEQDGTFKSRKISFGQWGYLKNLYSDSLEAYFSLIEGDVVRPLTMLLNIEPLNNPQRLALIGFIVIQRLRNPTFIEKLRNIMKPIVAEHVDYDSAIDNKYMQKVYDTLYLNNDLYERLARPILNNKWVLLNSEKDSFILPDTCVIYGHTNESQYVIFPISPTICMVILPVEEIPHRIVPYNINVDQALASKLTKFILLNVNKEFLAGASYSHCTDIKEAKGELEELIISSINQKCEKIFA